jgi:hypothetical protein
MDGPDQFNCTALGDWICVADRMMGGRSDSEVLNPGRALRIRAILTLSAM